jgi:hypothetical protein
MKSPPHATAGSAKRDAASSAAGAATLAAPVKPEAGAATPTSHPSPPGTQATVSPSSATPPATTALAPPNNGRKIIQSATLNLGAAPDRIDDVAQQVFSVVGSVNGIVDSSSVTETGGLDGNAQFELRVPSASLPRTMSALSRLNYAQVLSRTDNTQDINGTYVSAQRRLADAIALRSSLLKQLQSASTQSQIDSLKAQIHDAEASIAAAKADLNRLNSQVDYSKVSVTVQASGVGTAGGSGGGFTLHNAAHDALRVLTVAAGVALIVLAVAIPAGLLVALGLWIAAAVRRRRREHALDLA